MTRNELACVICSIGRLIGCDHAPHGHVANETCIRNLGAADRVLSSLKEQNWKSPEEVLAGANMVRHAMEVKAELQVKAAVEVERKQIEQEHIDAINDYADNKISFERLCERLNMNIFALGAAISNIINNLDALKSGQQGEVSK
jgi:hypothetical protein